MVVKKETPVKKAIKKKAVKGESYVCDVCGLSIIVDEVYGCLETHEIFCCEKPMKKKKSSAKVAKK